jgi:acetoin utilization deacetylase AcuC-like enzyme
MRTGIVQDDLFLKHDTGPYHPERKERLISIKQGLESFPHSTQLVRVKSRAATEPELKLIHTMSHIQRIQRTSGQAYTHLDVDTVASAQSYEVALHAVGGVLVLIDSLYSGQIQNGFAFVRPPGHHAEPGKAMGFCLFNNVAIGAAYALENYRLARVLIIDFDVHHGNGTQKAFYTRQDVLYISTHQFPLYPGTGDFPEVGAGTGKGYTVNLPLPAGTEDHTYNLVYERIISPICEAYRPQLILVSAGFDAYTEDPLAGMNVTPEGFAGITRTLHSLADKHCDGKVLFILEGGYHLIGLPLCVLRVLDEIIRHGTSQQEWKPKPSFQAVLEKSRIQFHPFWRF